MKETQKVISYRVRAYTDSEYIVEEYILYLQDELAYQQHIKKLRDDAPQYIGGHVSAEILRRYSTARFKSHTWDKEGFQYYIIRQCGNHAYEHPVMHNIDRFNFFLATHYFCCKGTEQSEDLRALNDLAYQYIQRHNAEVYLWMVGAEIRPSDDFSEQIVDDQELMRIMNGYLLSVGYINGHEYEANYDNGISIVTFLKDIGYWDNQASITSDNIARTVRNFLENARHLFRNVRIHNIWAFKQADALLGDEISKIECLNVGQANCSLGFRNADDQNPLVIFDLGAKPKNPDFVKKKLEKATEQGVVIVSHYDEDHINGVKYLKDEAANRVWILPQKRLNPSETEGKLFDFINPRNCIFLRNIDYSQEPFDPSKHILEIRNLKIYRGNCKKKDTNQSTSENARCLMCVVKKDKAMLLPGDCLYEEFPTCFSVDYLAVPHHSCCYSTDITNIDRGELEQLIVFAGPHRGYKHPDLSHISRLQTENCKVIYLMNHKDRCFKDKDEILRPQIAITRKSHIVNLEIV